MGNQDQEVFKVRHLILSFSILGLISLICMWIWQGKNTLVFVTDLFNMDNILINLGISGALGILMAVIAVALVKVTGTKIPEEENESLKELMMRTNGAIIIGVLPGIFEEILFRGFLLPFIQSFAGATWAVIITTIVFWGIHIPQYKNKIILNFNVIMLSLVVSILFIITESLWASIFAHMVYNYLVTLAIQKKIIRI